MNIKYYVTKKNYEVDNLLMLILTIW